MFHIFEIARHADHDSNLREARLIDELRPRWLKWRLDLMGEELLNAFSV